MKALRKLWAKYRTIIDWLKANAAYITMAAVPQKNNKTLEKCILNQ